LIHDWSKSIESEASGITLPARTDQLKEEDFTNLCTVFKNTIFEVVYNSIIERYKVGRVRLMMSRPKTCLSWHTDSSIRLHYPIKTQPECFMVIDDEVMHLQLNDWIMADTRQPHTAFNGSLENRVHLVAVILGENNE
jgi:hypothetical protein